MDDNELINQAEENGRVLKPLEYQQGFNNRQVRNLLGMHVVKMPSKEVLFRKREDGTIDFTNPVTFSDFLLDLEDLGFKYSEHKWKRILKSEAIKSIEPLEILCEIIGRAKWSGTDWLSLLVANLNLKGDPEENKHLIKKFFALAYATAFQQYDRAIDFMPDNRVCLILYSHDKATRKTSILRQIGLQNLLADEVGLDADVQVDYLGIFPQDERLRDYHKATHFLVNLDDIDNMLHSSSGQIKSLISQNKINYRPLWVDGSVSLPRRASYVGTTNNPTVLRDKHENRFMVFELLSAIDIGFMKKFDPLDFWRQMKEEAHKSHKAVTFNDEDLKLVMSRVEEYAYDNPTEIILKDYLEYCENCRLPFMEIMRHIHQCNLGLNQDKVAKALPRVIDDPTQLYVTVKGNKRYKLSLVTPNYPDQGDRVVSGETDSASDLDDIPF